MANPHHHVHLKLDPKQDVEVHRLRRRTVYVLRTPTGGALIGPPEDHAACGAYRPKRVVAFSERERVTCEQCRRRVADRAVVKS